VTFTAGIQPEAREQAKAKSAWVAMLLARAQPENGAGYPASALDLPGAIVNPGAVTKWEGDLDYYGAHIAGGAFYKGGGLPYTVDLNNNRTDRGRSQLVRLER
jgi:hypothetical protein